MEDEKFPRKFDVGEMMREARRARIQATLAVLMADKNVENATDKLMALTDEELLKDQTTFFYNKEGLKVVLGDAITAAQANNVPLSVLYIDGDQFKRINDSLNHLVGDQVIMAMSHGIRAATRKDDAPVRLVEKEYQFSPTRPGGDEFVVVLLGATIDDALIVSQRISEKVSEAVSLTVPQVNNQFNENFTVSIGVALWKSGQSAEEVVKEADEALKSAKSHKKQEGYDKSVIGVSEQGVLPLAA